MCRKKGLIPIIQCNKGQSGPALDKPVQMHLELWKSGAHTRCTHKDSRGEAAECRFQSVQCDTVWVGCATAESGLSLKGNGRVRGYLKEGIKEITGSKPRGGWVGDHEADIEG